MKLATKKRSTMKFFKQACYACALSLMLLLAAQARVFAQGSAAAPDPNQSNRKQPNPNEPKLDAAPSRSRGPGQQLVHQSNEAAGEEKDEMEEFKHSSSVKAIARLTGLGLQQSYWLSVVVNFAVIAVGIGWAAKKYLPGMFRDRTAAIQKAMQEAQKASA